MPQFMSRYGRWALGLGMPIFYAILELRLFFQSGEFYHLQRIIGFSAAMISIPFFHTFGQRWPPWVVLITSFLVLSFSTWVYWYPNIWGTLLGPIVWTLSFGAYALYRRFKGSKRDCS
jgi:hypothetical protein